jgi:hexosaminidase
VARRIAVGAAPAVTYRADGEPAGPAFAAVAARDQRLHPHRPAVLADTGEQPVEAAIDERRPAASFQLSPTVDGWSVVAGSSAALEQALVRLVRAARAGAPVPAGDHTARHGWRGLHVDLARQFLPATDVDWLVDIAAWHGLNRLHLHLTDDEGWRFPVPGYERLTEVGAWRGRGLPVPPLLGSGAAAYGGAYDRGDVARWHALAGPAGVELVPEVDLPGHSSAALAALPELADPDDTTGARSVQHFVDNALNPGVPATWPFLEAVFGALADAFGSPWLHLGGDEVAPGAWSGSPAAQRWAAARGVTGSRRIGAAFLRDVVALVRGVTGRRVGVWEEGADALAPGDGYAIGWTSAEACRRLAAAGHDVVAAPAGALYLDMAPSAEWYEPGTSWAGHTSVADVEAFDPTAGWTAPERERLLGVQACLWAEHVHDRPTLERLLFPRLTAVADAAWPAPLRVHR